MSTLKSLEREELLGKLAFLQAYNPLSPEMLDLALPSVGVQELFLSEKPQNPARRASPPGPLDIPTVRGGSITTTGGLISPQSETYSTAAPPRRPGTTGKPIDPTKVSFRGTPGLHTLLTREMQPLHKRELLHTITEGTAL